MLQQVPPAFLAGVLLPALGCQVHHKGPSAITPHGLAVQKQKRSDSGSDSDSDSSSLNVTTQAGRLLASYVACAAPDAARQLLASGLQAGAPQDVSRKGLIAMLRALAAAATQATSSGTLLQGLTEAEAGVWTVYVCVSVQLAETIPPHPLLALLSTGGAAGPTLPCPAAAAAFAESSLHQVQRVMVRFLTWPGSSFKAACCNCLLAVAAALAPAGSCSLAACARVLQGVPCWMLGPGGAVNAAVKQWLAGGSSDRKAWLADSATRMWQQYMHTTSASSSSSSDEQQAFATAADLELWHVASDAWLRVTLCCGEELPQELAAAGDDLAGLTEQLCSRSYLQPGLPDRVLIMLAQLLQMAVAAGRVAAGAPGGCKQQEALVAAALAVAAGPASCHLGRLLQDYSRCYRDSSSMQAAAAGSNGKAPEPGLSPAAWQEAARAEAAAQAAAGAVVLLAQHAARSSGEDDQALAVLLQLANQMAGVGKALAATPLPCASAPEAGEAGAAAAAVAAAAAAAAEQSRASAMRVSGHREWRLVVRSAARMQHGQAPEAELLLAATQQTPSTSTLPHAASPSPTPPGAARREPGAVACCCLPAAHHHQQQPGSRHNTTNLAGCAAA
jgi:hypothetical protein